MTAPHAPPAVRAALRSRHGAIRPASSAGSRAINHKTIARRFIVTAFVFFLLGGLLALAMRMQLARPDEHA